MTSTDLVGLPADRGREARPNVGSVAADTTPCVIEWSSRVGRLRLPILTEGSPSEAGP